MNSMNEKQFIETLGLFAKKGYQIIKDPKNQDDLPPFLQPLGYYPDFIIKSDSINYIIELSSSKNFKNKEQSEKTIEEIEKHKAWNFIFVQTDTVPEEIKKDKVQSKKGTEKMEKDKDGKSNLVQTDTVKEDIKNDKEQSKKATEKVEKHKDGKSNLVQTDTVKENNKPEETYGSVKKGYQKLNSVIETQQFEEHPEFILLYAWVLVETMLRKLVGKEVFNNDIKLMIEETVSQGLIENSEGSVLNDLQSLYHELSHGNFEKVIEISRIDPLIKIADKLYVKHFSK